MSLRGQSSTLTASAMPTTAGLFAHRPPSIRRESSTCRQAGKKVGAALVAIATFHAGYFQSVPRWEWCGVLKTRTLSWAKLYAGIKRRHLLSPSFWSPNALLWLRALRRGSSDDFRWTH